ncbi:MAG: SMP-30/gluconolactonase/LRE family protein [Lacisediminihabitans sp.]
MVTALQLTDPLAFHGEGPCWSPSWGGLRWVDMLAGDVLALTDGGHVERTHVGTIAAMIRPRAAGGAIVAREHDFAILHDSGEVESLVTVLDDPAVRFNEGGCDPQGRLYCGTMRYDVATGGGKIYRLELDHTVAVALEPVTISNGLQFASSGDFAYYVDTPTNRIDRLEYDPEHGFGSRSVFASIPEDLGYPDGIAVDVEGGVWVAVARGSAVHRYAPNGQLDQVVEVRVSNVTACAFGGDEMTTLFITTSREHIPEGAEPQAGALYSYDAGVAGLPVGSYAG